METTEIVVDRLETKPGKNGMPPATIIHGGGQKFWAGGKNQNLTNAICNLQVGDKATIGFVMGQYGPIVKSVNGAGGYAGGGAATAASSSAVGGGRFANEPKIKGFPTGFVAAWTKDVYTSGTAKTAKAAFKVVTDILDLVNDAANSTSETEG